jgi:hypothetical protein
MPLNDNEVSPYRWLSLPILTLIPKCLSAKCEIGFGLYSYDIFKNNAKSFGSFLGNYSSKTKLHCV